MTPFGRSLTELWNVEFLSTTAKIEHPIGRMCDGGAFGSIANPKFGRIGIGLEGCCSAIDTIVTF